MLATDDKDKPDPLCVSLMCLSVVGVMGIEGPRRTSLLRNSHKVGCTQGWIEDFRKRGGSGYMWGP